MRVHIKVFGGVQGVLFRSYTQGFANQVRLKGWVGNTLDGGVEVVAEGNKKDLEKLIDWAKTGPRFAEVENVEINWQKPTGEFDSFTVKY